MADRDQLILAIDQGTTNTKAILIDSQGNPLAEASEPVDVTFPRPGWVEQDPLAIWQSVRTAIDGCLQAAENPRPAAVAISNQRESAVVWERETGQPVGPLVSWQCRRTAPFCDALRAQGLAPTVLERTGLTLDPMFTAPKIRWLLDNTPEGHARAEQGELCAGTVDSWLLWNLTGAKQHRCDVTNASRTQLLNLRTCEWDDDLLGIYGIPEVALPEIRRSSALFGETVSLGLLEGGVPIGSMIGDSHGAMFGHGRYTPGSVKATYGTGSSLMTPISAIKMSKRGISTTVAWGEKTVVYALEGNIYVTGAAVQWLRDLLGLKSASEVADLAASVESTEGVYVVPAFVGLGAPHWDNAARGLVTGLTRGSSAAHLARAVIESIAYQIRDVFDVIAEEAGEPLRVLLADGGASRNDQLMQFQADIVGCPVLRNNSTYLSALGAAYLAGLTVGVWSSPEEIAALPRSLDRFEPRLSDYERERLYTGWNQAVARTMFAG